MQPIGLDGKPWEDVNARYMFNRIRKSAVDDMRSRDESHGIENGKVYREVRQETSDGRLINVGSEILHDKVPLRHTGRETRMLTKARWGAFCSKPRDESKCNARQLIHADELKRLTQSTEAVDLQGIKPSWTPDGESAPEPAMAEQAAPVKRGPGRPRKHPLPE